MAQNFKIFLHKNESNVHIKLKGDFDGSSAQELCNVLEKHLNDENKVFINTSGLSEIHPFGLNIFNKMYTQKICISYNITFTGNHKKRITLV